MMPVDPRTRLRVGDPDEPIVPHGEIGSDFAELVSAIPARMILSASGWRAVFARDGDEESPSSAVLPQFLVAAALAAHVFRARVRTDDHVPVIAVGIDTRPTGAIIARAAIRAFLESGAKVEYVFVAASPEIMCYAATSPSIDGFFYVSASHNPIGHNGIKMGGADGGVIGGERAAALITAFRSAAADHALVTKLAKALARTASDDERLVLANVARAKERSLHAYRTFTRAVVAGPGSRSESAYEAFRTAVSAACPSITGDLNGSARAASIDGTILAELGCRTHFINDTPGVIAHQIVPEGHGLDACRDALAATDGLVGYVPDNDGDRGNLVVRAAGTVRQLEAQEVFALCCVAELGWLVTTGALEYDDAGSPVQRVAVVVNGPTSMRIDRIARIFGVEVHRAEVGEANVVSRARELRDEGVIVRILGEGSNGGNITHPSAVRDPLQTLHAVLKLLFAPGVEGVPGPAATWMTRSGRFGRTKRPHAVERADTTSIEAILESLPGFRTTSAFEPRAMMRITSESHAELKRRFEELLPAAFESIAADLHAALGVVSYRVVNYEGTRERPGPGNRTGNERGGLKVIFEDAQGMDRAFAWMRGSGTEPVFRIMADVESDDDALEAALLDWLRELVQRADASTR